MKKILSTIICGTVLTACASNPWAPSVTAVLEPRSGSHVHGVVKFTQVGDNVHAVGNVWGSAPGKKGFHIHEKGDCSDPKAMSAGGHFNPVVGHRHGAPGSGHAGDLGNLVFDQNGRAAVDVMIKGVTVYKDGRDTILGRGLIVHEGEDDLKTDPTGNAGGRSACGVIGAPAGLTY